MNTYIAEEVDKWVVATVGHGQPVGSKPDNVDVWIAEK